jgi:hypothetical protein
MCQFEMELTYVTVPALSPNVFMKGVAKNTSQYQLLSGKMNVFLDSFFIAQSHLKVLNLIIAMNLTLSLFSLSLFHK